MNRVPTRVNYTRLIGFIAILLAVVLTVLVVGSVAQASFQLEYVDGVEDSRGMNVPQRALGQEGFPLLQGTVAVQRPEPVRAAAPAASGDVWGRLRNCESPDGRSSASGRYHGYFQFSQQTWNSVGGSGNPGAASYAEQLKRAKMLQARSGWGQWPACSRKLGLR